MDWFARSETVRLPLAGGEWLEVKADLRAGDLRGGMARALRQEDWQDYRLARVVAWLVDWSLRDQAGQPVTLGDTDAAKLASVENLTVPAFNVIYDAIEAHDKATQEAVAALGDPSRPDGATASSPASSGIPSSTMPDSSLPSAG